MNKKGLILGVIVVAIVVGIAAYFLAQPSEDDKATISIEVPIPQD